MKLYYESLEGAKIPTLTKQQSPMPYPKRYSSKQFKTWVKSVDIMNIEAGAVNFATADSIVTAFGDYRDKVGKELSQHFKYEAVNLPGEMKNIGSCWDGSKVGKVNEVDSLYVMKEGPFMIKPAMKLGFYQVAINIAGRECIITHRQLREQFANVYDRLISEMNLPDCLCHGGYNASRWPGERSAYSGLRYNGPAATSQFMTDKNSLLTWDVTPCIEFTDSKIQAEVRKIIHPILAQNPKKQFPQTPVHLIPDPIEECWRLSTAHFEAELLRYLSDEAPVKKALTLCKILCSLLKRWNQQNEEPTGSTNQGIAVVNHLIRHLEGNQPQNEDLERFMRFAHIWLPSDSRATYNEDEKSNISINTAAVKHIIIRAGLKEENAFAPTPNEDIVLHLVKSVFETLGNDRDFASDHTFLLESRISHFSVLGSNVSDRVNLARSVCEQCRMLLSGAVLEVRIDLIFKLFQLNCTLTDIIIKCTAVIACEYDMRRHSDMLTTDNKK